MRVRYRAPMKRRQGLRPDHGALAVLEALLWGFHNSPDGLCFPSYERIAARAGCARDRRRGDQGARGAGHSDMGQPHHAHPQRELDLFGQWASRWRIIRTSNGYGSTTPP